MDTIIVRAYHFALPGLLKDLGNIPQSSDLSGKISCCRTAVEIGTTIRVPNQNFLAQIKDAIFALGRSLRIDNVPWVDGGISQMEKRMKGDGIKEDGLLSFPVGISKILESLEHMHNLIGISNPQPGFFLIAQLALETEIPDDDIPFVILAIERAMRRMGLTSSDHAKKIVVLLEKRLQESLIDDTVEGLGNSKVTSFDLSGSEIRPFS